MTWEQLSPFYPRARLYRSGHATNIESASLSRCEDIEGMTFPNNFALCHKPCRSKRAMHALLFLTVVALAVSSTSCAKKVAVPDVTQQDLDQATKTLVGLQLKVGTVSGIPSG